MAEVEIITNILGEKLNTRTCHIITCAYAAITPFY
jgi:hypothetical protein